MPNLNYEQMLRRLTRSGKRGEGLHRFVARQVKTPLATTMDEADRALLAPCFPLLARAVELACPAVLRPTSNGLTHSYGLPLPPGDIFIAAASSDHGMAFNLDAVPDEHELCDLSECPAADFWPIIAETISALHTADAKEAAARAGGLARALFSKVGTVEVRKFCQLADQLRAQHALFIPTLACVAARDDVRTAGVLMSMLLPASEVSTLEAAQ